MYFLELLHCYIHLPPSFLSSCLLFFSILWHGTGGLYIVLCHMLFICRRILVLDLWYSVSVCPVLMVNGLAFLQRCYSLLTAESACHTHIHTPMMQSKKPTCSNFQQFEVQSCSRILRRGLEQATFPIAGWSALLPELQPPQNVQYKVEFEKEIFKLSNHFHHKHLYNTPNKTVQAHQVRNKTQLLLYN